jgi:hypothetical protein
VAITKFLKPDRQSKLLNAANIKCDDERGKKGKGKGGKERVTKDEDEMQMISNGIAVLHSLFLHSSTPH